jgi:short-subunit dehydrogenase
MKNVLITGANRGLGKALAEQFETANGVRVHRHGRNVGDVVTDLYFIVNHEIVSDYAALNEIDIFVNNAAVKHDPISFTELSEKKIEEVIAVNLFTPFLMLQKVYKKFEERGHGLIININSLYCMHPSATEAVYGATKMAMRGLLQALSIESQGTDVNILDVYLGATNTDMNGHLRPSSLIDPNEAARIIVYNALWNSTSTCLVNELVIRKNVV